MWETVAIGALVLCCLIGVLTAVMRLPGTWLIAIAAVAYGWWDGWNRVTVVVAVILVAIAAAGEIVELFTSVLVARRAGASRQAAWGGLVGGILGMLFLSIPVFFPPIGTILGAVVGCFFGALLAELAVRRKLSHGAKVGLFSVLGLVAGMVIKIAIALLMTAIVLTSALCVRVGLSGAN